MPDHDDLALLQLYALRYAARCLPGCRALRVKIEVEHHPPISLPLPCHGHAAQPSLVPPAPPSRDGQDDTREPPWHSEDFRSVCWGNTEYTFSPTQASVVGALWERWEGGGAPIPQAELLREAGSDCTRLRDVFRNHPAWNTLIVSDGQGGYALPPWE